jgi:hypothetical protein
VGLRRSSRPQAERIASAIGQHGFRLRSNGDIVRPIEEGRQAIAVGSLDYGNPIQFDLVVLIRFREVERIRHLFSSVEERYQGQSFTTLTRPQFLGGPTQWEASGEADVPEITETLATFAVDRVVPFLDRYRTLVAVESAINRERIPAFDDTDLSSLAQGRIIMAHLTANPAFDTVLAEARGSIAGFIAPERDTFEALATYLQAMRINDQPFRSLDA